MLFYPVPPRARPFLRTPMFHRRVQLRRRRAWRRAVMPYYTHMYYQAHYAPGPVIDALELPVDLSDHLHLSDAPFEHSERTGLPRFGRGFHVQWPL